jgi:hypothetical protein
LTLASRIAGVPKLCEGVSEGKVFFAKDTFGLMKLYFSKSPSNPSSAIRFSGRQSDPTNTDKTKKAAEYSTAFYSGKRDLLF